MAGGVNTGGTSPVAARRERVRGDVAETDAAFVVEAGDAFFLVAIHALPFDCGYWVLFHA